MQTDRLSVDTCTKTELPAEPPLVAHAGALLVLSASMGTQRLHSVKTG